MKSARFFAFAILLASCTSPEPAIQAGRGAPEKSTITHSLFNDKSATISEDNIQKILSGTFSLKDNMKAAIVRLRPQQTGNYYGYNTDEEYLKTQQSYVDTLINGLLQTGKVTKAVMMPELLISTSPGFTTIREAAVRMQADIVVVYAISTDVYYDYKVFSKTDVKAFATTQLMVMDVRTGLIPFSTVVTRDKLSNKQKNETDLEETKRRTENEAGTLAIKEVGTRLSVFFNGE